MTGTWIRIHLQWTANGDSTAHASQATSGGGQRWETGAATIIGPPSSGSGGRALDGQSNLCTSGGSAMGVRMVLW